jgi:uncharacterized protein (TIGR02147 family)
MDRQEHIQFILNRKLTELKAKNASFSNRAFAKKLGLQPSATNEILKGKRRVSYELAEKIADKLLLDPTERMNLLKDFPQKLTRKSKYKDGKDAELSQLKMRTQEFDLMSDWAHYAILNLIETANFKSDVVSIAERLVLTEKKVTECLKTLTALNLISKDESGEIKRTYQQTNTTDDVLNLSIQKMHISDMEIAKEKLTEVDVTLRDFTSYTLAFDINKMAQVKVLIREFQDAVDDLMKDGTPTEVYKMNSYIYPLTKIEKDIKTENLQ